MNFTTKINLDSLYERKRKADLNRLKIYDKILERIHKRIKITSRQQMRDHYCFFVIPEYVIGVAKYDVASCTSYLIEKLIENEFHIKYTHPNLLFISWDHYIPQYVRQEYKKKTGKLIDGFGNPVKQTEKKEIPKIKNKPNFKKIESYKPTGNLVYNNNLIKRITANIQ